MTTGHNSLLDTLIIIIQKHSYYTSSIKTLLNSVLYNSIIYIKTIKLWCLLFEHGKENEFSYIILDVQHDDTQGTYCELKSSQRRDTNINRH